MQPSNIVLIKVRNKHTGDLVTTRESWFDASKHERITDEPANSVQSGSCECGCGENASPGKRFIRGHQFKKRKEQ